jgi:hypothetical protein
LSNDLLVVGSGLEAHLVLHELSKLAFDGEIIHLPAPLSDDILFTSSKANWNQGPPGPKNAWLVDVWGKKVLSFSPKPLKQFEPGPLKVDSMPTGLSVNRTQRGEHGVVATLSDGTDVLCQAVLFCDGLQSGCRKFWDKPVSASADPHLVQRWSFLTENLLNLERWDFRWATAKSLELVPLSENRLRVRLRFKSRHGSKLSASELRDLFSEFGSDITALFENVTDDKIDQCEETSTFAVHRPAQGCLALGRAAWSHAPFLTFDWLATLVGKELNILKEQLRTGLVQEESFEAQAREVYHDFHQTELFFRRQLHSDNTLLNPLRNLILSILPNGLLAAQVKKRLYG